MSTRYNSTRSSSTYVAGDLAIMLSMPAAEDARP
jgi:hypothetical protein